MSDENARTGADRMSLGLGSIPDKIRGDMDKIIELDAEIEQLRVDLRNERNSLVIFERNAAFERIAELDATFDSEEFERKVVEEVTGGR